MTHDLTILAPADTCVSSDAYPTISSLSMSASAGGGSSSDIVVIGRYTVASESLKHGFDAALQREDHFDSGALRGCWYKVNRAK